MTLNNGVMKDTERERERERERESTSMSMSVPDRQTDRQLC